MNSEQNPKRQPRKRPADGQTKDARILFALPSSLKQKIEEAAASYLLETSEWIRRVLAAAVDETPAVRLETLRATAEAAIAEAERAKAAYAAALKTSEED